MTEQWLRFGVSDGYARWSSTWKLWATMDQGGIQVCLGSSCLNGYLLTRNDGPDPWRVSYASLAEPTTADGVHTPPRVTELVGLATRPQSVEGRTCVFRLLIPSSSVNRPRIAGRYRYVSWIPQPPTGRVAEVAVIVTENRHGMPGWPTRAMVGFAMLGSLEFIGGERVSVFYRCVDASSLAAGPRARRWVHPGGFREPGRSLAVGSGEDGAVVIHDRVDGAVAGTVQQTAVPTA